MVISISLLLSSQPIFPPSFTPHLQPPPFIQLTSLLSNSNPPFPLQSHHSCQPSFILVVNNSNELGEEEVLALAANETSVTLPNLQSSTRYRFYLNAKTKIGAGPAITQEALIMVDEGKSVEVLPLCSYKQVNKSEYACHQTHLLFF